MLKFAIPSSGPCTVLLCASDRFAPRKRHEEGIVAGRVVQTAIAWSPELRCQRGPDLEQRFGNHFVGSCDSLNGESSLPQEAAKLPADVRISGVFLTLRDICR